MPTENDPASSQTTCDILTVNESATIKGPLNLSGALNYTGQPDFIGYVYSQLDSIPLRSNKIQTVLIQGFFWFVAKPGHVATSDRYLNYSPPDGWRVVGAAGYMDGGYPLPLMFNYSIVNDHGQTPPVSRSSPQETWIRKDGNEVGNPNSVSLYVPWYMPWLPLPPDGSDPKDPILCTLSVVQLKFG